MIQPWDEPTLLPLVEAYRDQIAEWSRQDEAAEPVIDAKENIVRWCLVNVTPEKCKAKDADLATQRALAERLGEALRTLTDNGYSETPGLDYVELQCSKSDVEDARELLTTLDAARTALESLGGQP